MVVPWGALVLTAGNLAAFVVAGSAPDRAGTGADEGMDPPSIGQLVGDGFRHPSFFALVVAAAFLLAAGIAAERWAGPVGLVSAYVVGGFAAGFVEAVASPQEIAGIGSFGGTTTVLAMWAGRRGRTTLPLAVPTLVGCAWLWSQVTLRVGGMPWLGVAAAALVGVYASRSAAAVLSRSAERGER